MFHDPGQKREAEREKEEGERSKREGFFFFKVRKGRKRRKRGCMNGCLTNGVLK